MATPEDLQANADYIRMADQYVEVSLELSIRGSSRRDNIGQCFAEEPIADDPKSTIADHPLYRFLAALITIITQTSN